MGDTQGQRTEEILEEVPFLEGNVRWGGKIQILRVTFSEPDGTPRVFINKRLMLTSSNRYINLPRNGIEEMIQAIIAASESERAHHEALLTEINSRRTPGRAVEKPTSNNTRRDHRRNRKHEGDYR